MVPRVVLDTNVLVSAALDTQKRLVPHGRPALCLVAAFTGFATLVTSEELLDEYARVLVRPKFRFPKRKVDAFCARLRAESKIVDPVEIPADIVTDPGDTMVLATAVAGRAQYLVTGNTRHFPARYRRTRVLTPAAFLFSIMGDETARP